MNSPCTPTQPKPYKSNHIHQFPLQLHLLIIHQSKSTPLTHSPFHSTRQHHPTFHSHSNSNSNSISNSISVFFFPLKPTNSNPLSLSLNPNPNFLSLTSMAMDSNLQAILSAIASFFLLSLIFTFIYFICRSATKRRRSSATRRRTRSVRNSSDQPTSTSFISIAESQIFDPTLVKIEMVDLVNATRNFSPDLIVGDGSFGLVYKANLETGVTVAVKKLSADAFQGYREFRAEMETLGKIRHDNIVKCLGYCATGSDRILIYEFIEKGSLDQWLYDVSSTNNDTSVLRLPLSWTMRIKIMRGVAKGLAYMHNLEQPIIHRDIKASNVLLDADFKAHIADFGLARTIQGARLHVSTQVAGTMGYMPPEYIHGAHAATVMGDVYSFGILMFEIVTGRRPNWPIKGENGEEIRLVEWAMRMVSQNREIKMLDAGISKEDLKEREVLEFFRIAMLCTGEVPKNRPKMSEVVELLDQIQHETTI